MASLDVSFFNLATWRCAQISNAGNSLKLSVRDSDSVTASALNASANGNTGRAAAREPERKDWPHNAKLKISNFVGMTIQLWAGF